MSRGSQNQQTIDQAKQFLAENRPIVVAVFKRQARIGTAAESSSVDVEELVELLVLLMTMTSFIDVSGCGAARDERHADSCPSSRINEMRNDHEERPSLER